MKKNINKIFDEATAKDLDIMLGDDFTDEQIDPVMLKRLEKKVLGKKKAKTAFIRRMTAAVAACVVLTATISGGMYAYAAEAKEYKAAVNFFDEYNLSDAGLTRSEIKKVYRDISSESFSYSKTAEVIKSSVYEGDIEGYEISSESPSPESIAEFWNSGMDYNAKTDSETMTLYYPDTLAEGSFELVKSNEGVEEWKISFDSKYMFHTLAVLDNGYVVHGRELGNWAGARFAYVTEDGQIGFIGSTDFVENNETDPGIERIEAVVGDRDGNIVVFAHANNIDMETRTEVHYICFAVYDTDGNTLTSNVIPMPYNIDIKNAILVDDGYVLQISQIADSRVNDSIVKLDFDGNLVLQLDLTDNGYIYNIEDMASVNGDLYISTYVIPEDSEDYSLCNGGYSASIRDQMTDKPLDISDEELLDIVNGYYTAILLVCDVDEGKIKDFYTVNGAVGARLNVSDSDQVVWDVKRIVSADIGKCSSYYSVNTKCIVSRYFIGDEAVSEVNDTDKYSAHSDLYHKTFNYEDWREWLEEELNGYEGEIDSDLREQYIEEN